MSCDPSGCSDTALSCLIPTDGKIRELWERNLCFKTEVSEAGPQRGAPAIVPAGMMGDRAVFASSEEVSSGERTDTANVLTTDAIAH